MAKNNSVQIKQKLDEYHIHSFFYFSFIENFEHFLKHHAILPKNDVENKGISYKSFANEEVQELRHAKMIPLSRSIERNIHDCVPLYLRSKTPTLYANKNIQEQLFFIVVKSYILLESEIEFSFSDGNAGHSNTQFFNNIDDLDKIPWDVIRARYWNDFEEGLRKRNSEFLIYPKIPIDKDRIWRFGVVNEEARKLLGGKIKQFNIDIDIEVTPSLFF